VDLEGDGNNVKHHHPNDNEEEEETQEKEVQEGQEVMFGNRDLYINQFCRAL